MADQTPKAKETFKLPGWIAVVISVLAIMVGGAGWINSGLQARADAKTIKQEQEIAQLQHEDSNQNALITANTFAISDIKTEVADRLGRIETTLSLIEKRTR